MVREHTFGGTETMKWEDMWGNGGVVTNTVKECILTQREVSMLGNTMMEIDGTERNMMKTEQSLESMSMEGLQK